MAGYVINSEGDSRAVRALMLRAAQIILIPTQAANY